MEKKDASNNNNMAIAKGDQRCWILNYFFMSEEAYRDHLMRTFQDNGLLDQLKVQLRTSLLEKLKDRDKSKALAKNQTIAKKVAASLIQQFLFFNGHHYTLSVFAPESGVNHLYERSQLASFLSIQKDIDCSLLEVMLRGRLPGDQGCRVDAMMQTEGSNNFMLDQKLRQLDDHFYRQLRNTSEEGSEERIARFQNDTRRRLKEEMDREVDRIRTIEAAAIRAQESQKARRRVQHLKQELQEEYFGKLDKLKDREKEALALVKHKTQQLQRMESELSYIQLKEDELKSRTANQEEWIAGEKARLERQERILKEQQKNHHEILK